MAVAGREAGGGQGHCCPAAGSHQDLLQAGNQGGVPTLSPHWGVTVAPCAGTGAGAWQN